MTNKKNSARFSLILVLALASAISFFFSSEASAAATTRAAAAASATDALLGSSVGMDISCDCTCDCWADNSVPNISTLGFADLFARDQGPAMLRRSWHFYNLKMAINGDFLMMTDEEYRAERRLPKEHRLVPRMSGGQYGHIWLEFSYLVMPDESPNFVFGVLKGRAEIYFYRPGSKTPSRVLMRFTEQVKPPPMKEQPRHYQSDAHKAFRVGTTSHEAHTSNQKGQAQAPMIHEKWVEPRWMLVSAKRLLQKLDLAPINLARWTDSLFDSPARTVSSWDNLRPGDLIFNLKNKKLGRVHLVGANETRPNAGAGRRIIAETFDERLARFDPEAPFLYDNGVEDENVYNQASLFPSDGSDEGTLLFELAGNSLEKNTAHVRFFKAPIKNSPTFKIEIAKSQPSQMKISTLRGA